MTPQVLIIGADRVMPKLFYFAEHLQRLGLNYAVYTHDATPLANRYAAQCGAEIIAGPPHRRSLRRMLVDISTLLQRTGERRIVHAELYSDYHVLASFAYFLVLRARRIPVVLWCRGELYSWDVFKWWQRLYFRFVVPRAKLVILKETYMRATLERGGVATGGGNILELHNTVPLPAKPGNHFDSPRIRILFMNMFKSWRNVDFCAEVAAELRSRRVDFEMKIVGEKQDSAGLADESRKLRAAIARHGLHDCVSVEPFSNTPTPYYEQADVFLLPANLVYCNYALLEAMSHGVVPLVNSADADYRLIVEDGVSGFGLALDAAQWADAITALVHDPHRARTMSCAARARIEREYSTDKAFALYCRATELVQ